MPTLALWLLNPLRRVFFLEAVSPCHGVCRGASRCPCDIYGSGVLPRAAGEKHLLTFCFSVVWFFSPQCGVSRIWISPEVHLQPSHFHLCLYLARDCSQVVSFQRSAGSRVNTFTNLQRSPPGPELRPQTPLGTIWTEIRKGPCCAACSSPLTGGCHRVTTPHAPHRCSPINFLCNHFDGYRHICTRGKTPCALCLDTCCFLI